VRGQLAKRIAKRTRPVDSGDDAALKRATLVEWAVSKGCLDKIRNPVTGERGRLVFKDTGSAPNASNFVAK
jgi:hypothetical protein